MSYSRQLLDTYPGTFGVDAAVHPLPSPNRLSSRRSVYGGDALRIDGEVVIAASGRTAARKSGYKQIAERLMALFLRATVSDRPRSCQMSARAG